jgi:hypothetical protein
MSTSETRPAKRWRDVVGYLICAWIVVGYVAVWLVEAWPNRQAPEPLNIFSDVGLLFFPNNLLALLPGLSRGYALPLGLLAPIDLAFMLALVRFGPLAEIKAGWKLLFYLVFSAASSFIVMKIFFNYMFLQPFLSNAAHRM